MKKIIISLLLNIALISFNLKSELAPAGRTGATGTIGAQGPNGAPGNPGSKGTTGATGSNGIATNLTTSKFLCAYHNKKQYIKNSSFLNPQFSNISFQNITLSQGIVTPNFTHFTALEEGTYQFSYTLFFLVNINYIVKVTTRAVKGPYLAYLKPGMPIPISENGKEIIFSDIPGTDQSIILAPNGSPTNIPFALACGKVVGDFTIRLSPKESVAIQATTDSFEGSMGVVNVEAPLSILSSPSVNALIVIKKIG